MKVFEASEWFSTTCWKRTKGESGNVRKLLETWSPLSLEEYSIISDLKDKPFHRPFCKIEPSNFNLL